MQPSVNNVIATEKVGGGKDTEDQNTEVNKDSIKCPGLTEPLWVGGCYHFQMPSFHKRPNTTAGGFTLTHTPPLPCLHEKTQQVWSPTFSTNHHNTTKSRIRQSYRWPKVNLKELIDKILDNSKGLPSIIIPHYFSLYHLLSLHYGSGVSISLLLPKHPILKEIFGQQQSEKF